MEIRFVVKSGSTHLNTYSSSGQNNNWNPWDAVDEEKESVNIYHKDVFGVQIVSSSNPIPMDHKRSSAILI